MTAREPPIKYRRTADDFEMNAKTGPSRSRRHSPAGRCKASQDFEHAPIRDNLLAPAIRAQVVIPIEKALNGIRSGVIAVAS